MEKTDEPLVLVVDDEDLVRKACERTLRVSGYRVLCARSGREAVELFQSHADEVVCVLLDVVMPEIDGAETLIALRSLRQDLPIVVTSATDPVKGKGLVSCVRRAKFLRKPYELDELCAAIQQVTGPCEE